MLLPHLFTAKVHPEVSGTILAKAFIAQKHLQQIHSSQETNWTKKMDLWKMMRPCIPGCGAQLRPRRQCWKPQGLGLRQNFPPQPLERKISRRAIVKTKRATNVLISAKTFMPMMMLSHPSAMGAWENAETGAATNEGSASWESQQ